MGFMPLNLWVDSLRLTVAEFVVDFSRASVDAPWHATPRSASTIFCFYLFDLATCQMHVVQIVPTIDAIAM